MMFDFLFGPTIESLNARPIHPVADMRSKVKILIIDDEQFKYIEILRKHQFNPTYVSDLDAIDFVKDYHIILCDIKGVGKNFESKYQGAHVINEIYKFYPNKVIIGYTGSQFDAEYNKYFSLCDDMVKKDIDSDEWVEKLDFAVKCCIDPTYQWKKIHKMLVDRDIPSKLILKIERNFVAKFNKRNLDFPISAISRSIPGDIKTILLNVASSAIFQAAISV